MIRSDHTSAKVLPGPARYRAQVIAVPGRAAVTITSAVSVHVALLGTLEFGGPADSGPKELSTLTGRGVVWRILKSESW